MSIIDHTNMTETLARSICNTNSSPIKDFTGGVISDSDENRIINFIESELDKTTWRTSGVVPERTYLNIARELEVYTAGMNRYAISDVIKTNGIFGYADKIKIEVGSERYEEYVREYNSKVEEIDREYDKHHSRNMTAGSTADVLNELGNQNYIELQNIVKRTNPNAKVSPLLSTSVNAIMSGSESVLFSSFPPKVQRVFTDLIASGSISTRTSGKTFSLGGGGSITLNDTSVDTKEGDFGVSFSDMDKEQKSDVAADAVVAETDSDPATKEALSKELESSEIGTTLAAPPVEKTIVNDDPVKLGESILNPGTNFISSVEELEYEMGSMTRDITEVIVHWSETYTDANLSAEDLDTLTGAGKSAYHLIIKRDGSVQRGVPMNSVGNHCPTNGHNSYSIGVCLVGGVNVSSGDNELEQLGANSLTRSQFNSLYQIFRAFFNHYPGGQALGHMDVDATQSDPGFDVRDYVYNNFNKTTLYQDPLNQPALSPSDILAAVGRDETQIPKDPDVMDKKF